MPKFFYLHVESPSAEAFFDDVSVECVRADGSRNAPVKSNSQSMYNPSFFVKGDIGYICNILRLLEAKDSEMSRKAPADASPMYKSSLPRFLLWKAAFEEFLNKPFTGVGLHVFMSHIVPQRLGMAGNEYHAHNLFLNTLVEFGLAGFILAIVMLHYILKASRRDARLVHIVVILLIAGQMVDCFIYDVTFTTVALFFFAAGAAVGTRIKSTSIDREIGLRE